MASPASPISSAFSASDMLSAVPSDLFAGLSDTGGDTSSPGGDASPDTTSDDTAAVVDAAPAGDDNAIEFPDAGEDAGDAAGEAEPEPEPEPAAASPDADAAAPKGDEPKPAPEDELPEGVRKGKDRKGKEGYFLEENRYKTFHGNHQVAQQAAEILGEPLTLEAIDLRNRALLGSERFWTNLTSGDPTVQADVVAEMMKEMKGALEVGETGVDPTVPFAETVYSALKKDSPDGYAALRAQAGKDLIGEMFDHAARTGNKHLSASAQHFALTLNNIGPKPADWTPEQYLHYVRQVTGESKTPFYTDEQLPELLKADNPQPQSDSAKDRRIAELEAKVNGRTELSTAEQFDAWNRNHVQAVNKSVFDDVVTPALASVANGWKNFPEDYKRQVLDPLNREIKAVVSADPGFNQKVLDKLVLVRRATSEQVRQRIGEEIRALYVNRARLAADKVKAPLLKTAAEWLQWKSQQNHDRRNGAQTRTAPKGPSAPVQHPVVPDSLTSDFKNGNYDPATATRQMLRALGAGAAR